MVRRDGYIQHGFGTCARMALVGVVVALATQSLGPAASSDESARPKVLTTVAPLTNIVKNVGGPRIQLQGLVPSGTDSHTFEPSPSDIRYIAAAALIILNGLYPEAPSEKLVLANKKLGTRILKLDDHTIGPKEYVFGRSFPRAEGHPNPHLCMDPLYAIRYAEMLRDALAEHDPTHAAAHQERTRPFTQRLHKLDRAIAAATKTIPPNVANS